MKRSMYLCPSSSQCYAVQMAGLQVGQSFSLLSQQQLNELLILRRRAVPKALGILRHPAEPTCGSTELEHNELEPRPMLGHGSYSVCADRSVRIPDRGRMLTRTYWCLYLHTVSIVKPN